MSPEKKNSILFNPLKDLIWVEKIFNSSTEGLILFHPKKKEILWLNSLIENLFGNEVKIGTQDQLFGKLFVDTLEEILSENLPELELPLLKPVRGHLKIRFQNLSIQGEKIVCFFLKNSGEDHQLLRVERKYLFLALYHLLFLTKKFNQDGGQGDLLFKRVRRLQRFVQLLVGPVRLNPGFFKTVELQTQLENLISTLTLTPNLKLIFNQLPDVKLYFDLERFLHLFEILFQFLNEEDPLKSLQIKFFRKKNLFYFQLTGISSVFSAKMQNLLNKSLEKLVNEILETAEDIETFDDRAFDYHFFAHLIKIQGGDIQFTTFKSGPCIQVGVQLRNGKNG